jgi:hypothetical protein
MCTEFLCCPDVLITHILVDREFYLTIADNAARDQRAMARLTSIPPDKWIIGDAANLHAAYFEIGEPSAEPFIARVSKAYLAPRMNDEKAAAVAARRPRQGILPPDLSDREMAEDSCILRPLLSCETERDSYWPLGQVCMCILRRRGRSRAGQAWRSRPPDKVAGQVSGDRRPARATKVSREAWRSVVGRRSVILYLHSPSSTRRFIEIHRGQCYDG